MVCRVETPQRRVALSFDDGPSPRGVEAVLPLLARHRARATFFVIGQSVEEHPEATRAIAEAGHEIGNHSFWHSRMVGLESQPYLEELERTDLALAQLGIAKPRWMRPPYGAKFIGLGDAVDANGQTMVMWDVEEPSRADTPESYARDLLAQVRPGSIILIHPMSSLRELEREALPLVLEGLDADGYEIVSVGELIDGR
nr:polysaccharide deacetylase family protein [Sphingomicrobium nitratireducens]